MSLSFPLGASPSISTGLLYHHPWLPNLSRLGACALIPIAPIRFKRGERTMSVTDELLQNNAAYAESFDKGDLPLPPARGVAVVACMDARLDVHKILGLEEGDAHVIRNAGDRKSKRLNPSHANISYCVF